MYFVLYLYIRRTSVNRFCLKLEKIDILMCAHVCVCRQSSFQIPQPENSLLSLYSFSFSLSLRTGFPHACTIYLYAKILSPTTYTRHLYILMKFLALHDPPRINKTTTFSPPEFFYLVEKKCAAECLLFYDSPRLSLSLSLSFMQAQRGVEIFHGLVPSPQRR